MVLREGAAAKTFRDIIKHKYTLPLIVLVSFFVLSLGFGGPAYMSDEVGYLDKAATIAGSTVHLSTSWFGGYSFMISPAFFLSSDPFVEWNIVLALNALMWAGVAALLQYILRKTHPKASPRALFFAAFGAMLYPSWLSMSGYAFATSGFVLVFMAALASLLKSGLTHPGWLGLAALFTGYLCWIHPLGFIFLGLFMATLAAQALLKKQWLPLAIGGGAFLFGTVYLVLVQPWLNHAMRGSISNDAHYTNSIHSLFSAFTTAHYWLQVAGLLIGLLFFVVIATFGLVIYGSVPILRNLAEKRRNWRQAIQDPGTIVMLIPLLAVAGVIVFTAFSWGATQQFRIDQWVYGRYTDMYLLPLISFGILASWRSKQAAAIAGLIVVAGVLLSLVTNARNTSFGFDNKVNIQGHWPMHLASVVHADQYWVWGVLGALGILVCGIAGMNNRKVYLTLLLVPLMLAGGSNYLYKQTITRQHSSVSSLYGYIKANYMPSDCIGFTPNPDSNERFNLYSYYLHGYNVKKMTLQQWQQQDCKGPYFTYDSTVAMGSNLQVTGLEAKTNLYMVTRSHEPIALQPSKDTTPVFSGNELVGYAITFN
jgi:hypothetical protein